MGRVGLKFSNLTRTRVCQAVGFAHFMHIKLGLAALVNYKMPKKCQFRLLATVLVTVLVIALWY